MSKQTDTRGYNPVVFRGRPHRRSLRDRRLCRHLLSPLSDRAELELAIRETLRVRVIAPTDRLIAELEKGAKPATAYFALTRFVIPNVLYHMQVWGLHCAPDVWSTADDAFARFCSALADIALAFITGMIVTLRTTTTAVSVRARRGVRGRASPLAEARERRELPGLPPQLRALHD